MNLSHRDALEMGLSIIPIRMDKLPYFSLLPRDETGKPIWKPFQKRQATPAEVAAWEKASPPSYAFVTGAISHLITFDFDGAAGLALAKQWNIQPHRRTGSGWLHWDVVHPGWYVPTLNGKAAKEFGKLFPGLDVKGDGGYVIFTGRNAKGTYEWLREPGPDPAEMVPIEVWEFLKAQEPTDSETNEPMTEPRTTEAKRKPQPPLAERVSTEVLIQRALRQQDFSGRNVAGFDLACQLRDNGYSFSEAATAMHTYRSLSKTTNIKGETEPYKAGEVSASLREAYGKSPREPWGASARTWTKSSSTRPEPAQVQVPTPPADAEDSGYTAPGWPDPLDSAAYHGLAGEVVRTLEPSSEADPAAHLAQLLVAFGNVVGHRPYFRCEATRHPMNLFSVLVGMTSKARKGTSWNRILELFRKVDYTWSGSQILDGLSSGEGLIESVRDPKEAKGKKDEADEGVQDKRLLVVQGEFSSTLKVMDREGNILSAVLRNAWDSGDLRTLTRKSNSLRATGSHISIVGHITRDELRRFLSETDQANGFANRFLWIAVKRSQLLPHGGEVDNATLTKLAGNLAESVKFAQSVEQMKRDAKANRLWERVYEELSEGQMGLLGAVTSRAEAQVVRLSCLYALLDKSATICAEHLDAALAVWQYSEASARYVFGDALGDPVADTILTALRDIPEGLTRTEISSLFSKNKTAAQIDAALTSLHEQGKIRMEQQKTGSPGRDAERWFATRNTGKTK